MIPGKQYTPELVVEAAWRHKWLIILPAIVIATAVIGVTYRLPNKYRSDSLILVVPQRVPESYVHSTVTQSVGERLQSISQQILSRTRLERMIQDFDLYPDRRKTDIMEDIVEQMRRDIALDPVRGDAFRVGFISEDPRLAMRVTERLASLYIDESLRDREVLADDTSQFLEAQLQEARLKLTDNDKQLENYRRQHSGELPTQLEANLQGMHNIEMQLQALNDSLNRDRDRRLLDARMLADASISEGGQAPPSPNEGDNPGAGSAADQLRAAQAALRGLEMRYKPEHPDIVHLKRTIADLQKRADIEAADRPVSGVSTLGAAELARLNRLREAQNEIENLDRQIADKTAEEKRLRAAVGEYQKRIEAEPTRETELISLTRDYETLQQNYRGLLTKREDSQISANLERRQIGEQFKIIDPARLPEKPFSPDRPRIYAIGLVGALACGLAFAVLAEDPDRTIRSEEDVRVALGVPVVATIPLVRLPDAVRSRQRRLMALAATAGAGAIMATILVAWRLLR